MSTDLYRDPSHSEMISLLVSHYKELGLTTYTEYRLPNRKRADILVEESDGVAIIEVKDAVYWHHIESAIKKYRAHANRLYIAAPFTRLWNPCDTTNWDFPATEIMKVGVLTVGWAGIVAARPALWQLRADQQLNPGRADCRASPSGSLVSARSAE